MKITILKGNREPGELDQVSARISEKLRARGDEVSEFSLRDMDIRPCTGCFNCWIKTPGTCVIKDDSDTICREFISSDFVILAAPLKMGFPDSLLKNTMDRLIPLIHPYLEEIEGEAHHMRRYNSYPVFGMILEKEKDTDQEDMEIVSDIYRRAAINLRSEMKFIKFETNCAEEVADAINCN